MRTTTLARGHDARSALSIAAQRAGQGRSSGNGTAFHIVTVDIGIGIEGDPNIGLVLQRDGRVRRCDDAPSPAIAHLTGDHGVEGRGSEKNGGLDRF